MLVIVKDFITSTEGHHHSLDVSKFDSKFDVSKFDVKEVVFAEEHHHSFDVSGDKRLHKIH